MSQKMSKKKKIILFSSIGVLLVAIIAASLIWGKKEITEVQTNKVEVKEILESKVSATGEIRAKETIEIQSEISGIITDLTVREGDRVKKGQLLIRLDPFQTQAEMEATKANYEASINDAGTQKVQIASAEANLLRDEAQLQQYKAQLEQNRSNYLRAERTYKRMQQLSEDNLVSREEYEKSQAEMRVYKAQVDASEAVIEQLKAQNKVTKLTIDQIKSSYQSAMNRANASLANLNRSRDQLRKTEIFSPIDGIITKRNVEKGERAVPGIQSSPQATLLVLADMSIVQVELKVDETDIINVALGNPAKVKVDALVDQEIDGTVTEIGSSPINASTTSSSQEAKDFKVIVDLINPPESLKTGLSATAIITSKTKHNVLAIPFQALTVRELELDEKGQPILPKDAPVGKDSVSADSSKDSKKQLKKKEIQGVFLVDGTQKARFQPVETGITGETEIEILKGLKEGQEIISGSYKTIRSLEHGTTVKINNTKKDGDKKNEEKA